MKELYRQFNQSAAFLRVVRVESRCARHPDVEIDYSDGLPFCNVCWYVIRRDEVKTRLARVAVRIRKTAVPASQLLIKTYSDHRGSKCQNRPNVQS
jgi:hypothetical protein